MTGFHHPSHAGSESTGGTGPFMALPVRFACCLAVAFLLAAVDDSGILRPLEDEVLAAFGAGRKFGSQELPAAARAELVFAICLAPALLRVEQPLIMIACGAGTGFVYCLIVSLVLLTSDVTLPVASVLLGLATATGLMETLAWSEERRRRRLLEQLEAARQQFTDMLVHDLKRRMSSILLSLSALERRIDPAGPDNREIMATIRASADRMLLLTGNLLDVRKVEEGRLVVRRELCSLKDLIQEGLRDQRVACELVGVRTALVSASDAQVSVDRGLFLRVLANLLWNAIQHAPAGSTIETGFGPAHDNRVVLYVANRGQPIPPGYEERLFTAFAAADGGPENSRAASTGLGLFFCKLAVEAHAGTIGIESPWPEHGDGVKVVISLPHPAPAA